MEETFLEVVYFEKCFSLRVLVNELQTMWNLSQSLTVSKGLNSAIVKRVVSYALCFLLVSYSRHDYSCFCSIRL